MPLPPSNTEALIGFQLYLLMGYIKSRQIFCCTTETVINIDNYFWTLTSAASLHPLDTVANTRSSP